MVLKTDYCLMQVKRIGEHSAILLTFIKLPVVVKIFFCLFFFLVGGVGVFYTGFTVYKKLKTSLKPMVGWLVGFVALRPKSTAMVIAVRSVHLTTLFPGQENQWSDMEII